MIVLLAVIWAVAMVFRMELRAQWWAYRLTRVESREDRTYYLARLAAIGDTSLGALGRVLSDSRPEVREMGITVLGYCSGDDARGMLLDLLGDEDEAVASKAATALAVRPDAAGSVPALREKLDSGSPREARAAAVALGRIPGEEAERALIEALAGALDVNQMAQIADSLGARQSRAVVPLLIELLTDDRRVTVPPYSQRSALQAVGAVQAQLLGEGIDPDEVREMLARPQTIGSIAARSLHQIANVTFGDPATQPAGGGVEVRKQWQAWLERESVESSQPSLGSRPRAFEAADERR